jgi:hypothetical protein
MPDAWELAVSLNPLANDAAADADQDGAGNLQDCLAGTGPFDPASVLSLRIDADPLHGGARLGWFGVSGRDYAVDCSVSLPGPPSWSVLTNGLAGTDAWIALLDPLPDPAARFYRLRVQRTPP